jgi:hypothetical protein
MVIAAPGVGEEEVKSTGALSVGRDAAGRDAATSFDTASANWNTEAMVITGVGAHAGFLANQNFAFDEALHHHNPPGAFAGSSGASAESDAAGAKYPFPQYGAPVDFTPVVVM